MNLYASLATLKSRLDITETTWDTDLLALLGAVSRMIDRWCERWFYVWEGSRYFDGSPSPLFLDDLLSIDTDGFQLDEDGDETYESTMAPKTGDTSNDYWLYPLNKYPKTWAKISMNSAFGGFASGVKRGIKITGKWGYGESATPYKDSGITVIADDATETELDVSAEGTIEPGHTILVESEQIYVSAASSDGTNKITVERAVNGTTGAAHATKAAYIYEYPEPVREACLIQAMRLWKRKDSAFQDAVGSPELGTLLVYKGLDADTKLIVSKYRKWRI
jgi:hypothetical protein